MCKTKGEEILQRDSLSLWNTWTFTKGFFVRELLREIGCCKSVSESRKICNLEKLSLGLYLLYWFWQMQSAFYLWEEHIFLVVDVIDLSLFDLLNYWRVLEKSAKDRRTLHHVKITLTNRSRVSIVILTNSCFMFAHLLRLILRILTMYYLSVILMF